MATVASLLRERVTLQVNSVDRIFLAGYVPKLQSEGMVVRFLWIGGSRFPRWRRLAGSAPRTSAGSSGSRPGTGSRVVHLKKGESKELVARSFMRKAERHGHFGVVMTGVAQEKTSAWRGFRSGGSDAHPALLIPADVGVPEPLLYLHPRP